MLKRLNSMELFETACQHSKQENLFELFKFQMIGDDSDFECAILCTGDDLFIHECEVYTEKHVYAYDMPMKTVDGVDVVFEMVFEVFRNPEI